MAEICDACYDPEGYRQVLGVIARRLQETGERWRMAYKALLLLEYLIKHGPEKVWRDVQQSGSVLQRLGRFEYVDGNQRDHGVNVRHRAQEIQGLVNDEGRVREERRKAAENKAKYSGYSASQMRTGGGGGGGGFGVGVGSRTTTTTTMKNPSSYDDGYDGDGQSTRRQGSMGGDLALGDEGVRGPKLDPVSATQARIASMKISNREVQYDDPVDDGKPAKKKLSDVRANPKIAASLGLKVAAAPASVDSAKPKVTATGAKPKVTAGHGAVDLLGTGSADLATGRGENKAEAWDPFGEAEAPVQAAAAAKEEVFDPFAVLDAPSKPAAAVDPFAAVVAAPSPKTETTKGDPFADLLG